MRGFLWVINESGIVAKLYFDSKTGVVKPVNLKKKDYEHGFKIAAWALRLTKGMGTRGEFGYAKENIVYAIKPPLTLVLVADQPINNSPFIYGFLRKTLSEIRSQIDGVVLLELIEEKLREMLKKVPKPLDVVKPKYDYNMLF